MAKPRKGVKKRDYKAEYQARLARAAKRGYSKDVARGHPRKDHVGIVEAVKSKQRPGSLRRGSDLDRKVARDAKRVFGFRPKREKGEGTLEYEEKLIELQKRRGSFNWTDEKAFVEALMTLGLTEQDAYTHWFSP